MVFHYVGSVHFCGHSWLLDVVPRFTHYRAAQSGVSPANRYARALSHHGKMDARVLRFLGLHRLQPIHALLVREYSGGNRLLHPAQHRIMVALEHNSRDWAFLRSVRDSAHAIYQKTSAPALLGRGLVGVDAS